MKPFAIVVSRFNPEVTQGLLSGAKEYLAEKKIQVHTDDLFDAPGAFEIPLIAQTLAKTGKYAGVIGLGCVIKGDTAHFEFISLGTAVGIQQASLSTGVPITFGVLTTYTDEQALTRSRPNAENKGREAAGAAYEAAQLIQKIEGSSQN